jgi:NDP-sugar pyrophosphorylase family protein
MKAMILSAGKGTRLGKITESIPKALVDINGKSALRIAVEKCVANGFDEIIVNVHHFAGLVEDEVMRLNASGFRITVSDERDELLETGGGLYKAREFFGRDPFLLYNVDIISDIDLSEMYRYHLEKQGLATLAVRNRTGNRFFLVDDSGLLKGWENISTGEKILTGFSSEGLSRIAFLGIHIIEPEIFSHMRPGVYSMTKLYLELAKDHNIFTYRYESGIWCDIGSPDNLEFIRKKLRDNLSE